jgi:hypothetical protein
MSFYRPYILIFSLFFVFSCSNREQIRETPDSAIQYDLPPKQEIPVLRVLNYKNRDEGASMALWLRRYLENGIAGVENLDIYRGSYLFIASIRSARLPVIDQWTQNYVSDRDFSRLVAERIQKRLEQDLPGRPPDKVYGPNYFNTVKAAYQNTFWGARQLDQTWTLAIRIVEGEDAEPAPPQYWGFILVSIPRETLEIQINELLSKIPVPTVKGEWTATKEQNAAFGYVRERFFEQF